MAAVWKWEYIRLLNLPRPPHQNDCCYQADDCDGNDDGDGHADGDGHDHGDEREADHGFYYDLDWGHAGTDSCDCGCGGDVDQGDDHDDDV